jgi:hypothetical protein
MLIEPEKPVVELLLLSKRPFKNYILNLLKAHIDAVQPSVSLDAGCGDLRNRWMFPGRYVGITHSTRYHEQALARGKNKELESTVYAMRLENDLSFLGDFDLVVCTNALGFGGMPIETQGDIVQRLSERVQLGGALIFNGTVALLPFCERIAADYDFANVVFTGTPDRYEPRQINDEWLELVRQEMLAPNVQGDHKEVYMFASGKKRAPTPHAPVPQLVHDRGVAIVEMDMPFLDLAGPDNGPKP